MHPNPNPNHLHGCFLGVVVKLKLELINRTKLTNLQTN